MTEQLLPVSIKSPSPMERVAQSAQQSAHYWGLDLLTSEALTKFATINYRIRTIKEDFVGTTTTHIIYRIDSWAENGFTYGIPVSRDNYASQLRILSTTAFYLYDTYLNKDSRVVGAAREVQRTVDDLFPNKLLDK